MNKILNFKKIVSIGFFAAFFAVFLSASAATAQASFLDLFKSGGNNAAATATSSKTYTLKTNKSGSGVVTSNDGKINCGSDCSEKYKSSPVATVTLMAAPSSGYSFDKWSGGGCGGSGNCTVKMTKSTTVTAKFKKVKTTGGGPQRTEGGSSSYSSSNSSTGQTSSPSSSSVSSAGSSSSSSSVSQQTLKVTVSGDGKIISSPSGISCKKSSGTCEAKFNQKDSVTLTASTPVGGSYSFGVWGKDCANAGKSPTCVVIMGKDKKVSATFNSTIKTNNKTVNVSIRKSGTGKGKVVSVSSGKEDKRISCGNDCSENYVQNCDPVVTGDKRCGQADFRAVPDSGNEFNGWGGCFVYSSAKDQCYVILDGDKGITANFKSKTGDTGSANKYKLQVVVDYDNYDCRENIETVETECASIGEVISNDGYINCGTTGMDCDEKYAKNAKVTLTAKPTGQGVFMGWSGAACGGLYNKDLTCEVKMSGNKKITAKFEILDFAISSASSASSFSNSSSVSVISMPTATVGSATNITATSATINTAVNCGGASSCEAILYYSDHPTTADAVNDTAGAWTKITKTITASDGQSVSYDLSALNSGTRYAYETVAINGIGTSLTSGRWWFTTK